MTTMTSRFRGATAISRSLCWRRRWRYWREDDAGYQPEHRRSRRHRVSGEQRRSLDLDSAGSWSGIRRSRSWPGDEGGYQPQHLERSGSGRRGPAADLADRGPRQRPAQRRLRNDLIYGGRGNDRISRRPGQRPALRRAGQRPDLRRPGQRPGLTAGRATTASTARPATTGSSTTGGATTVFPGSGTNRVDVADRHGDDRVVCAPGSTNHIVADRGDRIARSCRGNRSTIRYVRVQQPRSAH